MKTYSLFDQPLKVMGIPFFEEKRKLERLSEEVMKELPHLEDVGRRCAGGRVAFKTNSSVFTVRVTLKTLSVCAGMSLYACQSVQVMLGERRNAQHLGVVSAYDYDTKVFERTFTKSNELEQVTLYFPRAEQLENIEVIVEDDAEVTEPTPYTCKKKVVFYGPSICDGIAASNTTNMYCAILSRWLDFDYYNLGGHARGELLVADYINTLDMDAFVMDYDHNAPTVEELAERHKPFFDRIREVHPNIPIIMMTRPAEVYTEEFKARREVVKRTYDIAVSEGDQNVYFIDGETFYGETDRNLCALDEIHPNDLGLFRMAKVMYPILKEALHVE